MNDSLFEQVNALARATPWLHPVLLGYADYGVVLFGLLLVAGWRVARRSGRPEPMAAVICAVVATLAAVALNQPIVNTVHEARPYTTHPGALVLVSRSADLSFPSDHAVMAGAVALGLVFVSRGLAVLATAAALVMAFARVYIAAHYPGDALVGLVLGAGVALVVYLVARTGLDRVVVTASRSRRLRPLVLASSPPATTR
jgi:membrane-associated phospholipid phosphatase